METDNWYGTANSNWPVLETVRQGQVLTIKLGMAAYHVSHCLRLHHPCLAAVAVVGFLVGAFLFVSLSGERTPL